MKDIIEKKSIQKPYLIKRPRRNRKSEAIRKLVEETQLNRHDIVIPLFVKEGRQIKKQLPGLPGIQQCSLEFLLEEIHLWRERGFYSFVLFPVLDPHHKDERASFMQGEDNFFTLSLLSVKQHFPDICLMVDLALDPFTPHGHDGIVDASGKVLNDNTLEALGQLALLYAEAGVDVIAPSDMMDGRIAFLREVLDTQGYDEVSLLSYACKFASSCYGPFREAVESPLPSGACKRHYQLNPSNQKEALMEARLDEREGADILMVKPAISYLDVLALVAQESLLPLAAYQVSGEYAMVMAAHEKGWLDKDRVFVEQALSIKRAGAKILFTYAYEEIHRHLEAN